VTIERYTGNWHGTQAWVDEGGGLLEFLRGKTKPLPGLEGFHMAGQWAGGIGISTAAIQGRKAIQTICKRDKQRSMTDMP
jgi:hypothetical protein